MTKERRTRQRALVLEVVQSSDDHPTAAQIFQRVRRRYPGIAYATIYNALRWLVNRGEITEYTFGDAAARYDRNPHRHHHALCTHCGQLFDVEVRLPKQILQQASRRTGMKITAHHIQFLGLCSRCAT